MSTTVKLDVTSLVAVDYNLQESNIPWSSFPDEVATYAWAGFYAKYAQLGSQYRNKKIEKYRVYFNVREGTQRYSYTTSPIKLYSKIDYNAITEAWNENTITIRNKPNYNSASLTLRCSGASTTEYSYIYELVDDLSISRYKEILLNVLNYGARFYGDIYSGMLDGWYKNSDPMFKHRGSSYVPYIEIEFSDSTNSLSISGCSPTSGFRAKYSANTYNWSTVVDGFSVDNPTISHAYFRYRADASSQYTEVDCGSALSYTMPANTISTNSFQWQVSIVDSNGNTNTSDWFTISTEEALSTATIVYPKNTSIDGSDVNRFEWLHTISTGTTQTSADLQYSSDNGTNWSTLATVSGSTTYADISANTFSSGSYIWRVRTYNTDNVAGSWSETKPFTVIAKPIVSAVSSEQNPKPTISWQSDTQQAYRIYIEDIFDSGVVFGTTTSYALPIYLADGSYTVSVVVQNNYGLWSNPATAPINVSNVAGTPMTLVAMNSAYGIALSWTAVLSYAYYVVYRDGIAIAKIRENAYIDYISLGEHSYYIRGIYASTKNYGLSNAETIDAYVNELTITDLETPKTISIELNDSSYADIQISEAINNTSIYISSSDYPINEMSHFKSKIINFSCAFIKRSELDNDFRNMLGKLVCIKTKSGTSVVGNLLEQQRTENEFYVKYSCTLNQTNYEEEIRL